MATSSKMSEYCNDKTQIKIHESKIELGLIIQELNQLRNIKETLQKSINNTSEEEWEYNVNKINEIKSDIQEKLEKYTNPTILKELKCKIGKRRKKRSYLKRRNEKLKIVQQNAIKRRENLHKQIDDWLKNEKEKDLKILKQHERAKQTEIILFGVTKRKTGAERYIKLLQSIKELRRVRKSVQQKTDLYEKGFEEKIDRLIDVWKDALHEYNIEEEKLKSVLNDSIKSVDEEWKECLFGEYSSQESFQPNKSEQTLENFIEIRRAWDSFLVPQDSSHGSSIPIGWVMPNENPSDKWAAYQNSKQELK